MWWTLLLPALAGDLTLHDALVRSLGDNLDLAVDRLEQTRAGLDVQSAWSTFDPILYGGADVRGSSTPSNNILDGAAIVRSSSWGYAAGLSQALPSGGRLSLDWAESWSRSDSAGTQQATFVFDNLSLRLSHPVLQGAGTALAGLQAAMRRRDDQELAWRAALEDHVLRVSEAYWALVAAEEYLLLAERGSAIAEEQLADTREREAEGFAGSGDVLQVQRARGEAEAALVSARASRDAAHDLLRRLIGAPLEGEERLTPVDRPAIPEAMPDREAALREALARNTSWLRVELAVQAAELDLRVANNGVLPQLDLTGSVGLSGGGPVAADARSQIGGATSPSWGVGVDLTLPVALRQERAELAQARLSLEQAELRRAAAEQDLRLLVDAGVRAVERDRLRWHLAESTLAAATQGLEADRLLLHDGRGSTRDVVRSMEALQEAQVARLEAGIALQASIMQLARVAGTLLDGVGG